MRDRLIELLEEVYKNPKVRCPRSDELTCDGCKYDSGDQCDISAIIADHLLANGVIVPLVENGQTVYCLEECSCENIDGVHTECEFYGYGEDDRICKCEGECPYVFRVDDLYISEHNKIYVSKKIGKTVFLTREEAEKALKERE